MNYTLKIEDGDNILLEPKEFKINEKFEPYLRETNLLYPDIEHGYTWKDDDSEQSRQLSGKHLCRSLKISIKINSISIEPFLIHQDSYEPPTDLDSDTDSD